MFVNRQDICEKKHHGLADLQRRCGKTHFYTDSHQLTSGEKHQSFADLQRGSVFLRKGSASRQKENVVLTFGPVSRQESNVSRRRGFANSQRQSMLSRDSTDTASESSVPRHTTFPAEQDLIASVLPIIYNTHDKRAEKRIGCPRRQTVSSSTRLYTVPMWAGYCLAA